MTASNVAGGLLMGRGMGAAQDMSCCEAQCGGPGWHGQRTGTRKEARKKAEIERGKGGMQTGDPREEVCASNQRPGMKLGARREGEARAHVRGGGGRRQCGDGTKGAR